MYTQISAFIKILHLLWFGITLGQFLEIYIEISMLFNLVLRASTGNF